MNTLLTGLDKAGTVVKRKYSATCLVRYNNDFVVGFVFCVEKATSP